MSSNNRISAGLMTIGDELLIGQVIDTNSAWLGDQLSQMGISVKERQSVGDDVVDVSRGLQDMSLRHQVVVVTGGLGPTKDDRTKMAICQMIGCEMYFHEPTWEWIQEMFKRFGRTPLQAHKDQAFMPAGVDLIKNEMGTAPGMYFEYNDTIFFITPGVPFEMKSIFSNEIIPKLVRRFDFGHLQYTTILTVGRGESYLAQSIEDIEDSLPDNADMAYLPGRGQVRIRILVQGNDKESVEKQLKSLETQVVSRIQPYVFGYGNEMLQEAVGKILLSQGKKLTLAESCTGGYLASLITSVPGSSDYFEGGVVSYSNRIKEKVLGVSKAILDTNGPVSEECVIEMAHGALKLYNADIAVSISGFAGPGGGTPDKPVGTIWICLTDGKQNITKLLTLSRSRIVNVEYASVHALNMIRKFLSA